MPLREETFVKLWDIYDFSVPIVKLGVITGSFL